MPVPCHTIVRGSHPPLDQLPEEHTGQQTSMGAVYLLLQLSPMLPYTYTYIHDR